MISLGTHQSVRIYGVSVGSAVFAGLPVVPDDTPIRELHRGYCRGNTAVIRGKTVITGKFYVKLPR